MDIAQISYENLALGYLLIVIPLLIFRYYQVNLIRTTLIAVLRMSVQLMLVAVYLEFIFELDHPLLNLGWIVIMIIVDAITIRNRSGLNARITLYPIMLALVITLTIIDAFYLGLVIRLDNVLEARYFVPISGMFLGNTLNYTVVGVNTFFAQMTREEQLYRFLLIHTADRRAALQPFMRNALTKAINPFIGRMSVVGLIALPGMMTGQILGGSNPATAIAYQILIMLAIFVGGVLSLVLSLVLIQRIAFDPYDQLKDSMKVKK